MKVCIAEQLEEINSAWGTKRKIELFKQYDTIILRDILDYAFNPDIEWLVSEDLPKYTLSKDSHSALMKRLYQEIRKFDIFVNSEKYKNLNQQRRDLLFIGMLERLHPKDADLILHIRKKTLPYKKITRDVVAKAYPKLAATWRT